MTSSGTTTATAADIEQILVDNTGVPPETLAGNQDTPLADLDVDSLAVLELQAVAAKKFGVEVPDDALSMSVNGLVSFINEQQGS